MVMTISEVLIEEIKGVIEAPEKFYLSIRNGYDADVISIDKKTNEAEYLGPMIALEFIFEMIDEGKVKIYTRKEVERFIQSLKSIEK